jgi:hypothetical protein
MKKKIHDCALFHKGGYEKGYKSKRCVYCLYKFTDLLPLAVYPNIRLNILYHNFNSTSTCLVLSADPFPLFPFRSRIIKEGILRIASQPLGTASITLYIHHITELFLLPITLSYTSTCSSHSSHSSLAWWLYLNHFQFQSTRSQLLQPPTLVRALSLTSFFPPSANNQPKHPEGPAGPRLPNSLILVVGWPPRWSIIRLQLANTGPGAQSTSLLSLPPIVNWH